MPRKTTIPWPPETHEDYQLVTRKIERVTVSLLTLLNEAAEHNYAPYSSLLPNIRRRLAEAHEAAVNMTYHAPAGKGKPPMWVTLTKRIIVSTERMLTALDKIEAEAKVHRFNTVIATTEVMLDECLELLEGFKKVPLGDTPEADDNESDGIPYFSYLFSSVQK